KKNSDESYYSRPQELRNPVETITSDGQTEKQRDASLIMELALKTSTWQKRCVTARARDSF
ncbi:hypothetical protein ALC53_08953, partial [Atta colombica]